MPYASLPHPPQQAEATEVEGHALGAKNGQHSPNTAALSEAEHLKNGGCSTIKPYARALYNKV